MDREYELFARVIEAGSLAAAGRSMNLSPAMVSKRIAALEERLGARLLNRTTRKLATTDAGQRFYDRVVAILAASREAEGMVKGVSSDPAGRLRMTVPTSFGRMHVAPHLKAFLDQWPKLQLEIDLSDSYVDLVAERIDLAIRIAPSSGSGLGTGLTSHLLAPNRRVLCASPGYLKRHGTPQSLNELEQHRLLAAEGQLPWRLQGRGQRSSTHLVRGKSAVRTNSSEVARELAIAGYGVALRSTWDIANELRSGTLKVVMPDHPGAADVGIFAVHPTGNLVPASVRAFIAHLKAVYAPVPPWDLDVKLN